MPKNIPLPQLGQPLLSSVKIADPCPMAWEALRPIEGSPQARYCDKCKLNVTNLSGMTAAEASAFLASSASGNPHDPARRCVTYVVAPDGGPMTLDYRRPAQRRWGMGWRAAMLLGSVGASIAAGARYVLAKAVPVPPPPPVVRLAGAVAVPRLTGDVDVAPATQPTSRPSELPAMTGKVSVQTTDE